MSQKNPRGTKDIETHCKKKPTNLSSFQKCPIVLKQKMFYQHTDMKYTVFTTKILIIPKALEVIHAT